jgi:hypothetical protein
LGVRVPPGAHFFYGSQEYELFYDQICVLPSALCGILLAKRIDVEEIVQGHILRVEIVERLLMPEQEFFYRE